MRWVDGTEILSALQLKLQEAYHFQREGLGHVESSHGSMTLGDTVTSRCSADPQPPLHRELSGRSVFFFYKNFYLLWRDRTRLR